MKKNQSLLIIGFVILYAFFIFFIKIDIELGIASEMVVASVFFFALFAGFFIARQNDRFNEIYNVISERDGLFSSLYRIFGIVPRIQNEIRKIIQKHYTKILESNNWAYNEFNPSTTITDLTKSMASIKEEEAEKIEFVNPFDGVWDVIVQLQQNRKKIISLYHQRLLAFQWALIYIFAILVMVSFHFLQAEYFWINVLKIIFGTAVFLVIVLIRQLNDLSVFGKNFSRTIANDVLRIVEEKDIKELEEKENLSK